MALGTGRKLVILPAVDPRRRWSTMSRMSRLGTFGFGPPLAGSLHVRRSLSRRCRRIGRRRDGLFLDQLLGQGQKREDDRLLALLKDQRGLLGGQFRTEQGLQSSRIEGLHTLGRHTHSSSSWS